jgi:L-fuconate dehydratase
MRNMLGIQIRDPAHEPGIGAPKEHSRVSRISALETHDIRFPTSRDFHGSDAMNPDPDYSAAYVVLRTDEPDGRSGHGLVFTIGRGNDVQTAACAALHHLVVGQDVNSMVSDPGGFARRLTDDSQLRWLGPEKGVMHMAVGAVVNAAWDLAARLQNKPLWRVIADMSPEETVGCIDFRYLRDALTPSEALHLLREAEGGKQQRIEYLMRHGYPAYTTSPGWLGYSDEDLARRARQAVADGFRCIKIKVGLNLEDDRRRCRLVREAIGSDIGLAVDANQRWDRDEAIAWIRELTPYGVAWVEEPTSPDDVLALQAIRHAVQPVPVSTGEHTQNRILFKQFLQAKAVDLIQIDATRVGGVNENLAILLLAHKFGVRVFPHAGGVGLCELVQHLAMADFVAISGQMEDRAIEYVDHLHEHFLDPVRVSKGRYLAPMAPGFSAEISAQTLRDYRYPDGAVWQVRK